ncbi:hypothetical protein LSAT2_019815 [Lamellibrachia satsuma]|nr:hypothetical protein LSAT2_019815 [Lamellibrachia satsuma]
MDGSVKLAGLGAWDNLRLEAGMCLSGNYFDERITLVEASLAWTMVSATCRCETADVPGVSIILQQLKDRPAVRRVGCVSSGPPQEAGNLKKTYLHDLVKGWKMLPLADWSLPMYYTDQSHSITQAHQPMMTGHAGHQRDRMSASKISGWWEVVIQNSREIDWSAVPGTSAYLGCEATVTRIVSVRCDARTYIRTFVSTWGSFWGSEVRCKSCLASEKEKICQQHKPLGDSGSSDNLTVPPRRMVQRC